MTPQLDDSRLPTAVTAPRGCLRGIHTASMTIFRDTPEKELDFEANAKHIRHLLQSGIRGALILGSIEEQETLTREERIKCIALALGALCKETCMHRPMSLNNGDFHNFMLIVGVGGQSVAECVTAAEDAALVGASLVAVLPPSPDASIVTTRSLTTATTAVESFYTDIADRSPIPIIINSWPGTSSSNCLEVTWDMIKRLAKHANVVGITQPRLLQTNIDVEKIREIVRATSDQAEGFYVLAGASVYLIDGLAVGMHGSITGITNIVPRTIRHLHNLFRQGRHDEARELQGRVSAAERVLLCYGTPAIRYAMQYFRGYGGISRHPVPPLTGEVQEEVVEVLSDLDKFEKELVAEAANKGQK